MFHHVSPQYPERFLLPPEDLFRKTNDKYLLSKIADRAGIAYPETIIVEDEQSAQREARRLGLPVVLKLRNDEGLFLTPAERYAIVHSETELTEGWKRLSKHRKEILLQECIVGSGFGFSAVYDRRHQCAVCFQHRRLREYPVSGGPSTYCCSVREKELDESGRKLLDYIQWTGPAMVEFKYDEKRRRFVLLEVNPRYWGSLPLARKSGINIPLIHYQLVLMGTTGESRRYREKVKIKYFATDFIASVKEIIASENRFQALIKYIFEFFDPLLSGGIWMWSDPLPAFKYLIQRLKGL
jgi:predicted ATP-grasp superfamily ATP-dependent carboligase